MVDDNSGEYYNGVSPLSYTDVSMQVFEHAVADGVLKPLRSSRGINYLPAWYVGDRNAGDEV